MRVLTFSLVSGLCFIGLVIADQGINVQLTGFQLTGSEHQVLVGNGSRDRTSYRGSGRREIMASPGTTIESFEPIG